MYGHIYQMAEAVAVGAREGGGEVSLWQVPELVPDEILEKSGAAVARAAFDHVPVGKPTQLAEADAIIFGTPTRFGNMAAQMWNFLDQTGGCRRAVHWSARWGALLRALHRSTAVTRPRSSVSI